MDSKTQEHVDNAVNQIRAIFMKAATSIEEIKPGSKIPATELAKVLAQEVGMTGPQLYPTLKFLLDDFPGVEIRRGAHGGIFRPVPVTEKKETATEVVSTDATEVV